MANGRGPITFYLGIPEEQSIASIPGRAVWHAAKQSKSVDSYVITRVASNLESAWRYASPLDGTISPATGLPYAA